jgi:hypothetical protein
MVILKVNVDRIPAIPAECYAPRPVDVDRTGSFAITGKSMKVKVRDVHVFRDLSDLQSVETPSDPDAQLRCNLRSPKTHGAACYEATGS